MSFLTRRRLILSKIESTYGTDAAPGAAEAVLVKNINFTPQETNLVPRDLIRPYFGNFTNIPAAIYAKLAFSVELAGAGTAGAAAPYGSLLRASAFAEVLNAAAVTGTAQAGSTSSTLKLAAAASAVDNFYQGMRVRTTGGTGSGQSAFILAYTGSSKTATTYPNWTVTPDATTQYSIDAQSVYIPRTTGLEAVSLYFNEDGLLHKMLGCRGTVALKLPLWGIPTLDFQFTGIYVPPTDTAQPTPVTYSTFQQPVAVNNSNTTGLVLASYAGAMLSDFSMDFKNSVTYRSLVGGSQSVVLTDRKPEGSLTLEATTVAAKDWWTMAANATTAPFAVTHGTVSGNIVDLSAALMQLTKPSYEDKDGIAMLKFGALAVPTSGNDDFFIGLR